MSAVPPDLAASILPANAQRTERALEAAMRAEIDLAAVGTLWNPATCPPEVLPFLAWGLSISHWNPDWSEAQKRTAVADAIPFHQRKGTRAAVEEILGRFDTLLRIVEWWETSPRGAPHTFEVRAPFALAPEFLSAATIDAIVRDVSAAKPLRSQFIIVQEIELEAILWLGSGGMTGGMFRDDYAATYDDSRDWSIVLQTDDGEPILADTGAPLETN